MVLEISSRQNPEIKELRRLRRTRGDTALLEGTHLISEAAVLDLPLRIFASREYLDTSDGASLGWLWRRTRPRLVAHELLRELSESKTPRGVLGIVDLPRGGPEVLSRILAQGVTSPALKESRSVIVWLDGVQDPGNLGALARVCEAVGSNLLCLSPGCCHPNHPRALRASAGSLLRTRVVRDVDVRDLDACFSSDQRPLWFALAPRDGVPLQECNRQTDRASVIAVGGEGPGLSATALRRADRLVTIPLRGKVESLNVVVAAALALFHLMESE